MVHMGKVWSIYPKVSDDLIEQLLHNRGIENKDLFLSPSMSNLVDPYSIKDLDKAVDRIKKAIEGKEKIIIYGDFDVDGITATGILWEALSNLGANVLPYIPYRFTEGYGLHQQALKTLHDEGASLVISVDCGITAVKEAELAKKIGLDLIITDHHHPPEVLPEPYALVHSTAVAGAGVAYKLSQALSEKNDGLDLAALGTIADMVPLTNDNRILATFGLEELKETQRVGLKALMAVASVKQDFLSTYDVSFMLVPRLNAMGRLEHALDSLRLLLTKKEERARELAQRLSDVNQERQRLTSESLALAKTLVKGNKINVVSHESFNSGVVGLVAGKLVEEFGRPALVISVDGELAKGSARSVNSFNIVEAIRGCGDLLTAHGGHPMAAGFSLPSKNLAKFEERLMAALENYKEEDLKPILKIDAELSPDKISLETFATLKPLQPFGMGNPEPVFATLRAEVLESRSVGQEGKHLKMLVRIVDKKGIPWIFSSIGFGLGGVKIEGLVDLAYNLSENIWNSSRKIELKVKDIRPSV